MPEFLIIFFSILVVIGPISIVLWVVGRCKSCGSLKRIFVWDKVVDYESKEAFKVCRRCGDKVLAGAVVDASGTVVWFGSDGGDGGGGDGGG